MYAVCFLFVPGYIALTLRTGENGRLLQISAELINDGIVPVRH